MILYFTLVDCNQPAMTVMFLYSGSLACNIKTPCEWSVDSRRQQSLGFNITVAFLPLLYFKSRSAISDSSKLSIRTRLATLLWPGRGPITMRGSRGGGQGVWIPLKNHKAIEFLSPDPLKNHKATDDGLLLMVFGSLDPQSIRQLKKPC